MKKLTVKQHTQITQGLFGVGIVIALFGNTFSSFLKPHWLLWIGVAAFLSSFLYRLIFVRCPHCHDRWTGMSWLPEYCPNCGKKVDLQTEKGEAEHEKE